MAQAGDYDQLDDSSLNEESGGGKTSLFGKLKNKTKDQGKKLKTRLHGSKNSDDTSTEDSIDDETTSPLSSGPEESAFTDSGVTESEPEESSKPSTGEHFPGNFAGIADDKTPAEASADESGLSKDFEGLSTNEKSEADDMDTQAPAESKDEELESSKPVTEKVKDNVTDAKDQTTEKLFGGAGSEQKYTSPDAPATSETTEQLGDKATEAGKTWSQWAAEKVGYAKDTAAAKAPTTEEGTPVHEKAYDAAAGATNTAVGKATEAKNAAAAQIPEQSSIPSDPAQQTYFQKATGGIYGAKDSLFANTQPGEHDKALSQKVTESVGNLPASLKSSLGFGKPAASSPTTTSGLVSDAAAQPTSEEGAAPQSPGLVSRITGLFAAKKPETPTSESTISETGPETKTEVSEPSKPE